jgi:ribosome recycling factor
MRAVRFLKKKEKGEITRMSYSDLIKQKRGDFESAFERVKGEVSSIRTGRANSSLVEDIPVDYLGSVLKVKELATITSPEPRSLLIQPWDKQAIPVIEKAIRDNAHGVNPSSDNQGVRVTLPPLTEERRKEFIRLLHQKVEEGRIRVRQIREDILKKVQAEVKAKTAREDDLRKAKDELQKVMDDLNKRFDELIKKKEQELML